MLVQIVIDVICLYAGFVLWFLLSIVRLHLCFIDFTYILLWECCSAVTITHINQMSALIFSDIICRSGYECLLTECNIM